MEVGDKERKIPRQWLTDSFEGANSRHPIQSEAEK